VSGLSTSTGTCITSIGTFYHSSETQLPIYHHLHHHLTHRHHDHHHHHHDHQHHHHHHYHHSLGRYGTGLVVAKLANGTWSAPSAVQMSGIGNSINTNHDIAHHHQHYH